MRSRARGCAVALAASALVVGLVSPAVASGAAPGVPVLVAPAAGSSVPTGSAAAGPRDRPRRRQRRRDVPRAARTPGTPGTGDPFTLMLMPDTQNYVSTVANTDIMRQQAQWIADNREPLNTVFVAHLGDIVGLETSTVQWQRASQYMAILDAANVPSAVLPGNHDMNLTTGCGAALPAVLPGEPVRERHLELADRVVRRLPRAGPVRRRPRGPAEPGQLLPVQRGRHGLPAAQPRVQRAGLRGRLGQACARGVPGPAGDRRDAQLRRHGWRADHAGGSPGRRQQRPGPVERAGAAELLRVHGGQRALLRRDEGGGAPDRHQRVRKAGAVDAHGLPGPRARRQRLAAVPDVRPGCGPDPCDDLLAVPRPVRDGRGQLLHDPVRHDDPGGCCRPSGTATVASGCDRGGAGAGPSCGDDRRLVRHGRTTAPPSRAVRRGRTRPQAPDRPSSPGTHSLGPSPMDGGTRIPVVHGRTAGACPSSRSRRVSVERRSPPGTPCRRRSRRCRLRARTCRSRSARTGFPTRRSTSPRQPASSAGSSTARASRSWQAAWSSCTWSGRGPSWPETGSPVWSWPLGRGSVSASRWTAPAPRRSAPGRGRSARRSPARGCTARPTRLPATRHLARCG